MGFLCLPALLVGLWNRIQNLADSSKNVGQDQSGSDAKENIRGASPAQTNDYRKAIRQIIAEETTTEFEEMEHKMDNILKAVNGQKNMDPNAKKKLDDEQMMRSNHKQQISESQYLDLVTMINALGDEMKTLQRTVSESMNVSRRS